MNKPKLIIASDGNYTAAVIDGIVIGRGISRLDFSTESKDGEMESTLHILDLDVKRAELSTELKPFLDWLIGEEEKAAPAATSAANGSGNKL